MADHPVHIMQALDSDTFIEIRLASGKRFKLIPYEETKDGDQQSLDLQGELNRIACCITALDGVKTEVIVRNFVGRLIAEVQKSMKALTGANEVLQKIMGGTKDAQGSQTATPVREEDPQTGSPSNDSKNH
jgi:hypothetical protein